MPIPPSTPVERFATLIRCLIGALEGPSMFGTFPRPLALLIFHKVIAINRVFARIAARVAAGTFAPRRYATRRRQAEPKPRRKSPLPQGFGWLVTLMQETAVFGSQLQSLFADAEMVALMQAAPGPLRRPLRSLCRMLGVSPPPILALPPRTPPPPAVRPVERRRSQPAAPQAPRPRKQPPPRRHARGPPRAP